MSEQLHGTYGEWKSRVWPKDKAAGLRLGQSFCNFVIPKQPYPELFYETNEERAMLLIENLRNDYQW